MISLESFGHLMAAGAPRSGRSQLLRTVAAAVAVGFSCADVHLYGLDCGNGALLPLVGLPHCGAVVTRTQEGQAAALQQIAGWAAALDTAVPPARRPFRVDLLPSRITFAEAWNLRPREASPLWGLVGVGGDELTAAIASLIAPGVIVIDDADLLADCEAGGELSKIIRPCRKATSSAPASPTPTSATRPAVAAPC